MNIVISFLKILKYRAQLAIAFGAGTVVGFSAGVGIKVISDLLDYENDSEKGISLRSAKKLKDNLESQIPVPEDKAAMTG